MKYTRDKLALLEARYEELKNDTSDDPHVRKLSMKSVKKNINQFKEEIARYECRQTSQS